MPAGLSAAVKDRVLTMFPETVVLARYCSSTATFVGLEHVAPRPEWDASAVSVEDLVRIRLEAGSTSVIAGLMRTDRRVLIADLVAGRVSALMDRYIQVADVGRLKRSDDIAQALAFVLSRSGCKASHWTVLLKLAVLRCLPTSE